MHLLIISSVYPNNNNLTEGLFNEHHALALSEAGMRVTLVLCKPWIPDTISARFSRFRPFHGYPLTEIRNGVQIYYARYIHLPGYFFHNFTVASCAYSIIKLINKIKKSGSFDLMQFHGSWPVGLGAPIISHSLKLPFVITLHIEDDKRLYQDRVGRYLYARMFERSSAVVAVGSPLLNFAKEIYSGLDECKLKIVPNGVRLGSVPILKNRNSSKDQWGNIVSVGNLWPTKGIDLNLLALSRLQKSGVFWNKYLIVGSGPELERLKSLATKLGISDKVFFLGRLDNSEALGIVANSDIFSLPSWKESFGIVYLEAMAHGIPVIGCKGQGAEDIIRHNVDGLLVEPRNSFGLATAIKKLLLEPEWSRRLGRAGQARAMEFTWERTAKEYLSLYRQALNR